MDAVCAIVLNQHLKKSIYTFNRKVSNNVAFYSFTTAQLDRDAQMNADIVYRKIGSMHTFTVCEKRRCIQSLHSSLVREYWKQYSTDADE